MFILSKLALISFFLNASFSLSAQEDELVRLPGKGELRSSSGTDQPRGTRLKPGGGLFIMFYQDSNGEISRLEIENAIPEAFQDADRNGDGYLTALEQQAWADALPTRDDSLANPVRFDPNLDRRVSLDEFSTVITRLGLEYADTQTGNIQIASLKAPAGQKRRKTETGPAEPGLDRP